MYSYSKKFIPYLFLIPALIILGVFFFIPLFQTFYTSVFDYSQIYHPKFVGLENYIYLFKSPLFYKVLANTFVFLIVAVPVLAILPLFLAILLNQKIRFKTFYKVLIYIPVIVSIVVAAIAFKWIYAQEGILNYFIGL